MKERAIVFATSAASCLSKDSKLTFTNKLNLIGSIDNCLLNFGNTAFANESSSHFIGVLSKYPISVKNLSVQEACFFLGSNSGFSHNLSFAIVFKAISGDLSISTCV